MKQQSFLLKITLVNISTGFSTFTLYDVSILLLFTHFRQAIIVKLMRIDTFLP